MELHQIYRHSDGQGQMESDPYRFCPLCGQPLAAALIDHTSRQTCAGCGYIHFRNPAPTISLFIIEGNRVLLGKRSSPFGADSWATPSGYVEFGEDYLSAALREAREETGLDIGVDGILNVTDSIFPPGQHFLNIYLLAHVSGGQMQAGDDVSELGWFPLAGPFPEMAFTEDLDMIALFNRPDRPLIPVELKSLSDR